jgi:hypothetical protein
MAAKSLLFHLYTLFLFTKADLKTLIPSVVRYALLVSLLCYLTNATLFTASDTLFCSRRFAMQSLSSLPHRFLVVDPYFAARTRKSDASMCDRRRPLEPPRPPSSSRTHYCPASTHATLDDDSVVSFVVRGIRPKDPTH